MERADRLPLRVHPAVLLEFYKKHDKPEVDLDIVCSYPLEEAVSIIDNLQQFIAALVLTGLRLRAMGGDKYAEMILEKALAERVRGSAGLVYAWEQTCREMGFSACT